MPYLIKKEPILAAGLARRFVNEISVELVAEVARAVTPEDGTALCMRINDDVLRSHVHYGKAVLLLAAIRDIYIARGNEAKWQELSRKFISANRGEEAACGEGEKRVRGGFIKLRKIYTHSGHGQSHE